MKPHRTRVQALVVTAAAAALLAGSGCGGGGSLPESTGIGEDRRLAPCPDSPNCLSSQTDDPSHRVEPLEVALPLDRAFPLAVQAVRSMPRSSVVEHRPEDGYLHATFRSSVFRFVDDLELLVDRDARVIHVRSASRLGYYDFGANEKRVAALREAFARLQQEASETGAGVPREDGPR
jgi:uncharacterized protein (DUF1499 family)